MPPTNNDAGQSLRHSVILRKIIRFPGIFPASPLLLHSLLRHRFISNILLDQQDDVFAQRAPIPLSFHLCFGEEIERTTECGVGVIHCDVINDGSGFVQSQLLQNARDDVS